MATIADSEKLDTLADLLDRLGNVPPERIRFHPAIGAATEADLLAELEAPRKRICELIDGVLVEKAMGYTESILASYLISVLDQFVRPMNLGLVTSPDGTIRLWAGRVRVPDVAYFSWDRFPGRKRPEEPIPSVVPDLAIEIQSRSITSREMNKKRTDYFSVGVRAVWQIDPATRTVQVFTSPETPELTLDENASLSGDPILPGFMLSLHDLFSELDRTG